MRCGPFFELDERHAAGCVWLTLSGELDLETAPRLAERLHQLREEKRPVVVDLSGLEFMDSSGVYVLFDAIADARSGRWTLEVGHDLSPQVRRLFELMGLERFLVIPAASPGGDLTPGAAPTPRGETEAPQMTRVTGLS